MRYKEWLDKWLASCVKPFVKDGTYGKYAGIVKLHISPMLGEIDMSVLNAEILQEFVAKLLEMRSASTVNGIISVVKASLKQAVQMGVVNSKTDILIVRPKHREKKVDCFTLEEQRKIEAYIKSGKTQWLGILVCLYTGLRIGELMALTVQDIDLKQQTISISKSCRDRWIDGKYVKVIDTPKTENSKRIVPIPKTLLPYIKRLLKASKTGYIICNKGKDISVRAYQRSFELILKHLGISHRGFHSLRHTFATRALECGMDVKTLSEILGHKSVTITLNRYAHSLNEHKIAMMNKLGKLLE